jgi:hypothetical protein
LSGVARSAKTDWTNLGVGREYQILEILKYSSGLIFTAALTLDQNPLLNMAPGSLKTSPCTTLLVRRRSLSEDWNSNLIEDFKTACRSNFKKQPEIRWRFAEHYYMVPATNLPATQVHRQAGKE